MPLMYIISSYLWRNSNITVCTIQKTDCLDCREYNPAEWPTFEVLQWHLEDFFLMDEIQNHHANVSSSQANEFSSQSNELSSQINEHSSRGNELTLYTKQWTLVSNW